MTKASLTLARILFPQCPAIWRANNCAVVPFQWREVWCQNGKVTHSLRHVVLSVTQRTVHEMCDTHCHASALNNFVVTNRYTLEINFWTFQNFRHDIACTTSPDPQRHASLRTLSRVLPSLARQIACHGVNYMSCQCEACFRVYALV